jgi:3',5'-cyclic AMP phosphodiesterase CpdA
MLALTVSSCCQTLWLEVTRREGGSAVAIELPAVKKGPIPIPRLENRFLPGLTPTEDAQAYTDQLDPRNDPDHEITQALIGLQAIQALGDDTAVLSAANGTTGWIPAKVVCGKKRGKPDCVSLVFAAGALTSTNLPFVPGVARVRYGSGDETWAVALPCEVEGDAPPDTPGTTGQQPACPVGTRGTRIVLTRQVPVEPNTMIEVQLGTGFSLSAPLVSFVHLSDTQLRDPDVKLSNPVLSAQLDHLIESFEHDEDQELYGPELAEAIVATINEEVFSHPERPAEAPSFVIHTGDSIDAGTRRELVLFHAIMDRLAIPWFNVIGNHDVLVFGNFRPAKGADDKRCVSQQSIAAPYIELPRWLVPGRMCVSEKIKGHVDELDTYVAGLTHAASRKTFIDEHRNHNRAKVVATKSMRGCDGVFLAGAFDRQHGFDLYPTDAGKPLPGYYAFATELGTTIDGFARRAIFIALNSEDLGEDEGGNAGRLGSDQLAWFQKAVACADDHDLVFVFAHHQLGELLTPDGKPLRDSIMTFENSRNIVGYLYGHNHMHGLCREAGSCTHFWELEAGSLIEHPQEARMVRVKSVGAGLAFIETTVFTERLENPTGSFAQRVDLARRGADHDHCLRERCSRDERVRREDGEFTNARLFFKLP